MMNNEVKLIDGINAGLQSGFDIGVQFFVMLLMVVFFFVGIVVFIGFLVVAAITIPIQSANNLLIAMFPEEETEHPF